MLPNPLISIYQQYKQDTDSVASWLASTAKACGYPSDLLPNNNGDTAKKTPGRTKGKARSKAKKKGPGSGSGPAKVFKYIVALKDFIPLAEFITSSAKPKVAVPESFCETINRVIAVRAGFGGQLNEHGADTDAQSDLKHSYFVGVLEKVREVLKPRMSPLSQAATEAAPGVADTDRLANRFGALTIYEPSREFLDAPALERPQRTEEDEVIYEAEPQKSLEDALVAYTMMVNDLNRIRSHIEWIWTNYRDGLFDASTAAVATNTAIDLARNMMEDVVPLFEDHGGNWEVANKFFIMCCLRKGFTVENVFVEGKDNFNYDTYEIANDVYFVAYRILLSFLNVLNPQHLPLIKEGMFGTYDPTRDRDDLTGREKFVDDQILLMEFFTELVTTIRLVPGFPVEDEFLRGMKEMDKTRKVPFYLVFAAQIFLDIHHVLRDAAASAFASMVRQTTFMDNDLRLHFEFHEKLKVDHWPASNDHMLREVQRKIKWIGQDPVHNVKLKFYRKSGMPVPESMTRHRMLQYSPVLSGLILYHFRAEMYDIGIAVVNAWGSITYSWHLYNALRNENLIDEPWSDMEVVQTLIGESNLYPGRRPGSPAEYLSRFCLQMGVSAANFADPRRRRGITALGSRAGPRGIKSGIPVSSMFMDRYLRATGQVDWTPEHIDDIIARSEFELEGSADEGTLSMGQIDDPAQLKAKKAARRWRQKKKAVDGARMSPEQLIQPLTMALQAETMEISFPYLTMHRWCWRLLRAVKDACDPLLRQLYTPAYMDRENQLPFVVGYIFLAASGAGGGSGICACSRLRHRRSTA